MRRHMPILAPFLQTCRRIMCTDILGAEFGFDFVTAASRSVDFEKSYGLSHITTTSSSRDRSNTGCILRIDTSCVVVHAWKLVR